MLRSIRYIACSTWLVGAMSFNQFGRLNPRKVLSLRSTTMSTFVNQKPLILLDVDGVILHSYGLCRTKDHDVALRKEYGISEVPYDALADASDYLLSPTILKSIHE